MKMKIGQLIGKTKLDQRPLQLISDAYLSASACLMNIQYGKALKLEAKEHLELGEEWQFMQMSLEPKCVVAQKSNKLCILPFFFEKPLRKNHKSVLG